MTQPSIRDQPIRDSELVREAEGGDTLLNIPLCSMAEEPGEQSQSLFRPPMSDPEMDPERGATKNGWSINYSNNTGGS